MKYLNKEICAGIVLSLGFSGMAASVPIYNDASKVIANTVWPMSDGVTYGNEINIAAGWTLTSFSFEYDSLNTTPGLSVDVKFYQNDGAATGNGYATPGTLIYDSGAFTYGAGYVPTGLHDYTLSGSDLTSGATVPLVGTLPTDFTFTITFANFGNSGPVTLPLASATPGVSFGDYWQNNNNGGGWTLLTNSVSGSYVSGSYIVDLEGTSSVPEPSVYALSAVGSLLLLGASRLKRKS